MKLVDTKKALRAMVYAGKGGGMRLFHREVVEKFIRQKAGV